MNLDEANEGCEGIVLNEATHKNDFSVFSYTVMNKKPDMRHLNASP